MMARAMNDPLHALGLTTDANGLALSDDQFLQKIAEQDRHPRRDQHPGSGHRFSALAWGQRGDVDNAASFGTEYDWRIVDDTSAGSVNPALDDAVAVAGYTVPVLVGDSYPARYVLLVGHEATTWLYNPGSGKLVTVIEDQFRNGDLYSNT